MFVILVTCLAGTTLAKVGGVRQNVGYKENLRSLSEKTTQSNMRAVVSLSEEFYDLKCEKIDLNHEVRVNVDSSNMRNVINRRPDQGASDSNFLAWWNQAVAR